VLTFEPHPSRFFGRDEPKVIYSLQDKLTLLEALGVRRALFQRFDAPFAGLSPRAFVEEVLIKALKARVVIVGYDFAFGARRAGRVGDLRALCAEAGVEVDVVEAQAQGEGERAYSSTWARALINEGALEALEGVLTRPYHVRGAVARGYQRGRALGFPTANLALESELCPPPSVYAGWLEWGEGPQPAVLSVGDNPTFSDPHLLAHQQPWSVEVHVIRPPNAPPLDLYERPVVLWFAQRLREMRRFEGLEALKAQIERDRDEARALLAERPPPAWPSL
jgi:riboflavin kinase/FMN adenylyltransferase